MLYKQAGLFEPSQQFYKNVESKSIAIIHKIYAKFIENKINLNKSLPYKIEKLEKLRDYFSSREDILRLIEENKNIIEVFNQDDLNLSFTYSKSQGKINFYITFGENSQETKDHRFKQIDENLFKRFLNDEISGNPEYDLENLTEDDQYDFDFPKDDSEELTRTERTNEQILEYRKQFRSNDFNELIELLFNISSHLDSVVDNVKNSELDSYAIDELNSLKNLCIVKGKQSPYINELEHFSRQYYLPEKLTVSFEEPLIVPNKFQDAIRKLDTKRVEQTLSNNKQKNTLLKSINSPDYFQKIINFNKVNVSIKINTKENYKKEVNDDGEEISYPTKSAHATSKEIVLFIDIDPDDVSSNDLEKLIADLKETIYHECIHSLQFLLKWVYYSSPIGELIRKLKSYDKDRLNFGQDYNRDKTLEYQRLNRLPDTTFGLPGKKDIIHSIPFNSKELTGKDDKIPHALDDYELHANLSDDIATAKKYIKNVPQKLKQAWIKYFVGGIEYYKVKEAITEFYKQHPDVRNRYRLENYFIPSKRFRSLAESSLKDKAEEFYKSTKIYPGQEKGIPTVFRAFEKIKPTFTKGRFKKAVKILIAELQKANLI